MSGATYKHLEGALRYPVGVLHFPRRESSMHPPISHRNAEVTAHAQAPVRMAQLSTARQRRNTLLQAARTRARASARHPSPTRIRHGTQADASAMGSSHGTRRTPHLQALRPSSQANAIMGPRTRRQPHPMDRARAFALQSQRRPSQQRQDARALALNSSSATAATETQQDK